MQEAYICLVSSVMSPAFFLFRSGFHVRFSRTTGMTLLWLSLQCSCSLFTDAGPGVMHVCMCRCHSVYSSHSYLAFCLCPTLICSRVACMLHVSTASFNKDRTKKCSLVSPSSGILSARKRARKTLVLATILTAMTLSESSPPTVSMSRDFALFGCAFVVDFLTPLTLHLSSCLYIRSSTFRGISPPDMPVRMLFPMCVAVFS